MQYVQEYNLNAIYFSSEPRNFQISAFQLYLK